MHIVEDIHSVCVFNYPNEDRNIKIKDTVCSKTAATVRSKTIQNKTSNFNKLS